MKVNDKIINLPTNLNGVIIGITTENDGKKFITVKYENGWVFTYTESTFKLINKIIENEQN